MGIRSTPYTERHVIQRSSYDADQAEFSAIVLGSAVLEQGIYDDRVADSMDDFDPEINEAEPWHKTDLQYDGAAGSILDQIIRRKEILGNYYPFSLESNSLIYNASLTGVYEFCLSICQAQTLTKGKYAKLPRLFEEVARKSVEIFLGDISSSYHTGWPRGKTRPAYFKALMTGLHQSIKHNAHEQLVEWAWGPEYGLPDDPSPRYIKDEGVDFVAWKSHMDGRGGNLYLLGQCACGDDWQTKFHDIDLPKFSKWFHPLTLVDPVKVFCTPFHVTDTVLREASREAGLVFDRLRLTLLAEGNGADKIRLALKPQIESGIALVLTS